MIRVVWCCVFSTYVEMNKMMDCMVCVSFLRSGMYACVPLWGGVSAVVCDVGSSNLRSG